MATTETARLERETEETRAQLEQTLGELRARMSPGQLMDQATDYFRNNSGRAYLSNLRDEVVHNPVPVALIGAGIAWLAISGTMGRRHNGNGRADLGDDWSRTAGIADDLRHGGRGPSAMWRARQTAEGWADEAGDAMSSARERASEMGDRATTAYDEAVARTHQTAEGWTEEASSTAEHARETLREGADTVRERAGHMRDRAADMYDQTAGGVRRVARKTAQYGRAARRAVQPDGAFVNFCREQPMLVAGLGIAIGAAIGAMLPSSRPEREVMGEASRDVQDRMRDTAADVARSAAEGAKYGATEAAENAMADVERTVEQASARPNTESEPQSTAPYAEAAEAGTAAPSEPVPGEEVKPRS